MQGAFQRALRSSAAADARAAAMRGSSSAQKEEARMMKTKGSLVVPGNWSFQQVVIQEGVTRSGRFRGSI